MSRDTLPPVPWVERPTILLDGDQPYERRFARVPAEAVADAARLLNAVSGMLPGGLRRLATLIRTRTLNRFHREATALAAIVGADWRDIVIANVSYDLVLASLGCSTIALPTSDGPVLARNMDWFPADALARASFLIRTEVGGRLAWCNAGWPGAIGVVTGLAGRGFAVALNAVMGPEGVDQLGYPVLLHLRRVIEDAADFDEALALLSEQRLAAPALLTLVGTDNDQRVVIERTPRRHALRWGRGDEPLLATNDYRLLFQAGTHSDAALYASTCHRYDRLGRLFAGHTAARPVGDERLLHALTDPGVIQAITAQHVIARPRSNAIRLFVPRMYVEPARGLQVD